MNPGNETNMVYKMEPNLKDNNPETKNENPRRKEKRLFALLGTRKS